MSCETISLPEAISRPEPAPLGDQARPATEPKAIAEPATPATRAWWNWDYFAVGAALSLVGLLMLLEIVRIAAGR